MLERLFDYKQRYEKEYLLAKAKVQVIDEMIAEEMRHDDENATKLADTEVTKQPTDEEIY